jgi:DedD protein
MDQGLKERLVGAAVLVAIAVWLIPWVLDGPEADPETPGTSLQLPAAEEPMPMRTQTLRLGDAPEPSVEPAATPPTATPASGASAELQPAAAEPAATEGEPTVVAADAAERVVPAAAPAPAATTPPKPATTPPKPAAAPAATGDWVVQLGSFSAEANARRLAQQAGTYGYKAQVSSHKDGGRTLYRVRVGPQATRAAADAAASALRAHGISDARVVPAR